MPRIEEVKLKRVGLQWVGVRVGVRWVVGRDEGLLHLTSYFAMVSVAPAPGVYVVQYSLLLFSFVKTGGVSRCFTCPRAIGSSMQRARVRR